VANAYQQNIIEQINNTKLICESPAYMNDTEITLRVNPIIDAIIARR